MIRINFLLIGAFLATTSADNNTSSTLEVALISQLVTRNWYDTTCVVSGTALDSAIIWNEPLDKWFQDQNKYVSQYIPSRYNEYDCRIDKEDRSPCKRYWSNVGEWSIGNSLDHLIEPVVDRRWEKFKIFTTDGSTLFQYFNSLKYKINLSIRAHEAHIYLCDDKYPPYGNCYWIIFGGWEGKKSGIRKCVSEKVPRAGFPQRECKTLQDEILHTESDTILDESEWRHFTIEKKRNVISVRRIGTDKSILKFADNILIETPYIIVNSRNKVGYWKLHEYTYTFTTSTISTFIGEEMYMREPYFCMAIFVTMCENCRLTFEILQINYDQTQELIQKTLITPRKALAWQEERIVATLPKSSIYIKLVVTTQCPENNCEAPFWALDNFEICSPDTEVRTLTVRQQKGQASCQVIKYPNHSLQLVDTEENSEISGTNCSAGTFGSGCINCGLVLGRDKLYCDKSIICEGTASGKTICKCPLGYTGKNCKQKCPTNWYGVDCKEQCGYCEYQPCNSITGECTEKQCLLGFTGPLCKTPALPAFVHPPVSVKVDHTYCIVEIQNNEYEGLEKPVFYKVQYKVASSNDKKDSRTEWKETTQYDYSYSGPIEINGLEPLTTYDIRAILISNENRAYTGDYVKTIQITTTCEAIKLSDIFITTSNTSASLKILNSSESCLPQYYQIQLGTNKPKSTMRGFEMNLTKLTPFTNYTVIITSTLYAYQLDVSFKTEEGAPNSVEQLYTADSSDTSISFNWKPPQIANGNIRAYVIQYKLVNYLACGNEKQQIDNALITIEEQSTSTTISNLVPYSLYLIQVTAKTVISGKTIEFLEKTKATDLPQENEIPTINKIEAGSETANIVLNKPNCASVKGPVLYLINYGCSNSWCLQKPTERTISSTGNHQLVLGDLLPFSNYHIEIKISRDNGNILQSHSVKETFNTKPSVPSLIDQIVVYSKDERSASFRFKPPYPPNGEIAGYRLKCCYDNSKWYNTDIICSENDFQVTGCVLWSNFHCIELQQLQSNRMYTIEIQARNKDTAFNNPRSTEFRTVQEAPGVPENLTYTWDRFHNLTLVWQHPSITNGPLTQFLIDIYSNSKICNSSSFQINQNMYDRSYTHVIPLEGCFSTALNISVTAINIYRGPPTILFNVISPPKVPEFREAPTLHSVTNTSITINLPAVENPTDNCFLYVIITNSNLNTKASDNNSNIEQIERIWEELELPKRSLSHVAAKLKVGVDTAKTVTLGHIKQNSTRPRRYIHDIMLQNNMNYEINLVLINEFEGFVRHKVYTVQATTSGVTPIQKQPPNYALLALLILLVIPLALLLIIARRRKRTQNPTNPWFSLTNVSNNLRRNRGNPDVVPLTTNKEQKLPVLKQTELQLKNNPASVETEHSAKPSTSSSDSEFSKPIKIMEFEQYVKESIANGELERQHQLFPRGQTKPWDYGLLPQNKAKNRYNNLIAYDHSRVKLEKINNDPYSDYINANYIEGYNSKKAYIATQGPKTTTVNDFWRMIWQENVNYIVMLANVIEGGKKKTEQYWPNVNDSMEFDNIKVEYVSSRVFADYEYRTFKVFSQNVERQVEQLHFTSWPDHGVPLYSQSLVPFLQKLLTIPQGSSPIVVHCSAGVGRTGTIILCDLCLRMAAKQGTVDILKYQHMLRQQRANLVDNIEQYKLAHLVLLECLVAPHTSITCDEKMEAVVSSLTGSDRINQQLQYLNDTAWQDQAMRPPIEVTLKPEWSAKNRFQDIIPSGYGRVYLSRYPPSDEHSDYINAVEVDGFRSPQRFIVTQQPMPNTISDFWRMVDEKEVTTIVSLNKINLADETSCIFWPTSNTSEIQLVPFLTLQFHDKSNSDHYSTITIHLLNNKNKESVKRVVHLIILKGWPSHKMLPESDETLIELWEETERLSRGDNPIIVTCHDGAKSCGLFIALSFVIEKMKLEQECDVCLAVRTTRHNRKQFVTEMDQFKFLYRAAITYLSRFDLYSNFSPIIKK